MARRLVAGLRALWRDHGLDRRLALHRWALVLVAAALLLVPLQARADGQGLFEQHCAGCHVNGGNIIRRGKTLKQAALERQGLGSAEAIARIASEGVGQMSGYGAVLGEQGSREVADFIWQQALAGWPRG